MSQITYSTPTVHRSQTDSVIEFDAHSASGVGAGWESLRVGLTGSADRGANVGDIVLSARGDGPIVVPREIMPTVLAEIDRLMSGNDQAPFEPVSASAHVVAAEPAPITGIVPAAASL